MCVEATGVAIQWDLQEAGVDVMARLGSPLPDAVIESCRRTKVALKAPVTTPVGTGFRSVNVHLRHALDLYACVLLRLTQANLKNDLGALRACRELLMPLRDAWSAIKPQRIAA